MFLRYFAATHMTPQSDLGAACLAWVPFLSALDVPVRLAATHHVSDIMAPARDRTSKSPWTAHADLLTTEMDGQYINLVCALPEDWKRLWTRSGTNCRRNVLLAAQTTPVERPLFIEAALEYEVLIVPTAADAEIWTAMGAAPIIIPTTADRLEDFRAVIGL